MGSKLNSMTLYLAVVINDIVFSCSYQVGSKLNSMTLYLAVVIKWVLKDDVV